MRATPCPSCGKPSYAKVMCHECRRSLPHSEKLSQGAVAGLDPNRPRQRKPRDSSRPKVAPCRGCGQPRYTYAGKPVLCRDCRRVAQPKLGSPCAQCGAATSSRKASKFCSLICAGKADSARRLALRGEGATTHARRVDREAAAVGLRPSDRKRLRQKWKRQVRTCAYCPAPATTIDHVIPLIRGGTNYEGNLVPCCLSCNSRKSDRLVIEFRLGLRASQTYTPFRERPKVERVVTVKAEKPTSPCLICRQPCVRKTCSKPCAVEWNTRQIREAYRARVGLPPTWDVPTRPRRARPAA